MKLREKILLLLIPLIVLPLFSLGWIAYDELRKTAEAKVFEGMQVPSDYLRNLVTAKVHTAEANLALFANNNLIKKYVLTGNEEERYALLQGPVLRVFNSIQQAFPAYSEIRIFLPDGYEDIRSVIDNTAAKKKATIRCSAHWWRRVTLPIAPCSTTRTMAGSPYSPASR